MFGGARRGGAAATHFEQEDFGAPATGQDLHAALTISLPEAARGTKARVQLPTGKSIEVKIPAGLASGQQIRLKGQGWPSAHGKAGDALITVNVAPHPVFTPDGTDLRLELPITLYEAVLGGKVRVPTLDGPVELAIPAGTNSGRTFRLKGKGLKAKGGTGDLLATVRIVLPEKARRRSRRADERVARQEALRSARRYGVIVPCVVAEAARRRGHLDPRWTARSFQRRRGSARPLAAPRSGCGASITTSSASGRSARRSAW